MRVMKVKDLDQMLSTLDPEAVKQIYSTMEMQNWLLSNSGMQLMGAEDDLSLISIPSQALPMCTTNSCWMYPARLKYLSLNYLEDLRQA